MSGKRILFIDGDEAFIRDISSGVEEQGYQCIVCGSSVEGVELARTEHPDLIVVSVELTPSPGWSVCTRLKKDDDLKDIPLILTSSTSPQDVFEKHKKLKTRADEYLLKPYSVDELLRLAGPLMGVADTVSDDDLISEDESLTAGEYDPAVEEAIQVASDEPLSTEGEDLSLDPLGSTGDDLLDEASLGELASEELESERPGLPPDADGDDLDAFEQSFDQLSGAQDGEASATAEASEEALPSEASVDELTSPPESELNGAEASLDGLGEFADGLNLETADAEATAAPESVEAAPVDMETAAFEEELAVEAPVETAAPEAVEEPVAEEPVAEEQPAPVEEPAAPALAEMESEAAAPEAEVAAPEAPLPSYVDSNRVAELEARVASLEAELEGYRATEGSHHEETERLRVDSTRKDEELDKLHDKIREREKQIRELKDADSRASVEAAKARDEKLKREAQIKSLTQRTEQMSAAAQKLERDLAASREEAAGLPPLRAKVAELQQQLQTAQTAAAEAKSLRDDLEKSRKDLDRVRAAHGQAVIDLESHRSDLEAARVELTEVKRVGEEQTVLAQQLQKKLNDVEEQMRNFAAQAQAHGDRAGRARAQLLALAEELGLKN